jgi:hypothetical protein
VGVAESALRLQPRRPKPVARGSLVFGSAVRIRVNRRRLLRRLYCRYFLGNSLGVTNRDKLFEKTGNERSKKAFMRQMVYIRTERVQVCGCSGCGWTFNPSGPPRGNNLEEMKQNYERQRDKEYASHLCAEHPRAKIT